jgi:hypothetical protein
MGTPKKVTIEEVKPSILFEFKFGAEKENPYQTAEDYPRFRDNMSRFIASKIQTCDGLIPNPEYAYRITLEVMPNVSSKK